MACGAAGSPTASPERLPVPTVLPETTAQHQTRLFHQVVERVTPAAPEVRQVTVRMEARPYFADMAIAPAGPRTPQHDTLAWYAAS